MERRVVLSLWAEEEHISRGRLGTEKGIAKIFGMKVKEVKEKDARELIEPHGKWKGLLAFYVLYYDRKTEMGWKRK